MLFQWSSVVLFALVFMGIAIYGRLKTTSAHSFATGSGANPYMLGVSLATTLTSAATFIINPGLVYHYGLSALISFALAANLGIILGLFILVKGFRRLGTDGKMISVPQWIESHYGGGLLTRIFYALSSLLLIVFIVLIYVGLTLVLSKLLGISHNTALLSLIIFITLYNQIGGANSHVMTNFIQGAVMIVVAIFLFTSGSHLLFDGDLFAKINNISPLLTQVSNENSIMFRDLFEVIFVNIIIGFAIVCQPHILSKALFLKDDKSIYKMLFSAMGIGTIFSSVMMVGFYALLTMGPGIKPDLVVATYIMNNFGTTFQIIASLGILCAGISTLEAILLSLTVTFSFDIIGPIGSKLNLLDLTSKTDVNKILLWGKTLTVLTGVVVYYLSINQINNPNVSVAIFAFNGIYALFIATFIPVAAKIFNIHLGYKTILISSSIVFIVHFSMRYLKVSIPTLNPLYWTNPGATAVFALICGVCFAALSYAIAKLQYIRSSKQLVGEVL